MCLLFNAGSWRMMMALKNTMYPKGTLNMWL